MHWLFTQEQSAASFKGMLVVPCFLLYLTRCWNFSSQASWSIFSFHSKSIKFNCCWWWCNKVFFLYFSHWSMTQEPSAASFWGILVVLCFSLYSTRSWNFFPKLHGNISHHAFFCCHCFYCDKLSCLLCHPLQINPHHNCSFYGVQLVSYEIVISMVGCCSLVLSDVWINK